MVFSVSAVLKLLVDRFEPNLSITDVSDAEVVQCAEKMEHILLQYMEGSHEMQPPDARLDATDVDSHNLPTTSNANENDPDFNIEEEKTPWAPIETKYTESKLQEIYDIYQTRGNKSCLLKYPKLTQSELRSIIRHFTKGVGEHVKSRKVRQFIADEFQKVSLFDVSIIFLGSNGILPSNLFPIIIEHH